MRYRDRIAYLGALSLFLSAIELLIPRVIPFFRIGLANIPVMAALGLPVWDFSILLFITAWSDYLWPLVIATSKDMFVLEIGLTLLQDEYFTDYGQMMAGCAVALVPAMLLFIFFRRHIMEGIAMSGIKG